MKRNYNTNEGSQAEYGQDLIHLSKLLRAVILNSLQGIQEARKYGIPVFKYKKDLVCALIDYSDHIKIKFYKGHFINDKHGVLNGSGNKIKFIEFRDKKDVDPFIIYDLIKQSIRFIEENRSIS